MVPTKKARAEAILTELRERRASYEVTILMEYVGLKLEECKSVLISVATEDDFRRVQGEAAAWDRFLRQLQMQVQKTSMQANTTASY